MVGGHSHWLARGLGFSSDYKALQGERGLMLKPYKTPGSLGPEMQAVAFYRLLPESVVASYVDRTGDGVLRGNQMVHR